MTIQEIRVKNTDRDVKGEGVLHEVKRTLGLSGLEKVETARVYRLEGVNEEQAEILATRLFCEGINEEYSLNPSLAPEDYRYVDHPIKDEKGQEVGILILAKKGPKVIEVAYNPGVMNPEVASIEKAAVDLGVNLEAVDSSTEYAFYGDISGEDVQKIADRLLVNKTVEKIVDEKPETLIIKGEIGPVNIIPIIGASEEQLAELSEDKLFLNSEEMKITKDYFEKLGRNPRDAELETIAARWSEHCGHKTFRAKIIFNGEEKEPLYTSIKKTAEKYFGDLIISAFKDNSGVMKFYEEQAICGKVETHNSPCAIEPYGGAMTGSGGVFRDIMATGQGAKVTASTDNLCFARPDLELSKLPPGCLSPDYLQRRVIEGIRDYGNRMGIPTNNGSVHYHDDFRAKPTIIVGAYGILPESRAQKGIPKVNDLVVAIGGRTGRDGIHGATFSSGEMTDRTISVNSSAVQIGNAIEEKRMADALLECRDKDLIRAITDCGAAGFSSAIGELGEDIGVTVDIEKAPTKYPGLSPWEIWISESQERMVAAVDPEKIEEFMEIFQKYNAEATVLGHFDGSNNLNVFYGDRKIIDLDYDFLKNGLPQRTMIAKWEKQIFEEPEIGLPVDWGEILKKVLSHGNVCSKEPIVRQYDHTVQGTNVLPPFTGVNYDGPQDAVVLAPLLDRPYGKIISHGLNPVLNKIDPYWGSVWAAAEAVSNYVAVGGNINEAMLINNYIFPFPTEEVMGQLHLSRLAVVDFMNASKRPVTSGKDSLSSTYNKEGIKIEIPPVLCISVEGRIPDVEKTVSSDIKKIGSTLCLVGKLDKSMGGSTYYDINGILGNEVPKVDLKALPKVLNTVHESIKSGKVLSCHDVSEGGIITTVSEMCFGGDCGVDLSFDLEGERPDMFLFNETAGCFVIEVQDEKTAAQLFEDVPYMVLGKTKKEKNITNVLDGSSLFDVSVNELKEAWQKPMKEIFY